MPYEPVTAKPSPPLVTCPKCGARFVPDEGSEVNEYTGECTVRCPACDTLVGVYSGG